MSPHVTHVINNFLKEFWNCTIPISNAIKNTHSVQACGQIPMILKSNRFDTTDKFLKCNLVHGTNLQKITSLNGNFCLYEND